MPDYESSSFLGRQEFSIHHVKVVFLSDLTLLQNFRNNTLGSTIYSVSFGENTVCKSLVVYALPSVDHVIPALEAHHLVRNAKDGMLQRLLEPIFCEVDYQILSMRTRKSPPELIGVEILVPDGAMLFMFRIDKGAISNPALPEEFHRSIRVESA